MTEKARISSVSAISDYANASITGIQARAEDVGAIRLPADQSTLGTLGRASLQNESEVRRLRARTSVQTRTNT